MMYILVLSEEAQLGLECWKRSGQKKSIEKITRIFDELEEHPYYGIGHPEQQKGYSSETWSRQIDKKNRIVYSVHDNVLQVHILSTIGHYDDK